MTALTPQSAASASAAAAPPGQGRALSRSAFCVLSGISLEQLRTLFRRDHLPFLPAAGVTAYARVVFKPQHAVLAAAMVEFTRAGGLEWGLVAAAFATRTPAEIFAVAQPAGTWLAIAEDEASAELMVGSWLAIGRAERFATRIALVDLSAVMQGCLAKAQAVGIDFDLAADVSAYPVALGNGHAAH